jgi:tRNA dimethylallyltransferase
MQVYRRMNVGTAKPTEAERAAVPHHMIDLCEPDEPYSLSDWVSEAKRAISDIGERGALPIVCGGTGLYIDTLIDGTSLSEAAGDAAIRAELNVRAETEGAHALWLELDGVDPESAEAIHENNVRRVIRALEIYRSTGVTKSEWDRRSRAASPPYDVSYFVIEWSMRSLLYERIDRRVDEMFAAGLEAEARALWESGALTPESVGGQAIGYKELVPYFCGECTLSEATEAIKQATRRYAKRQETWFRRRKDAIRVSGERAYEEISERIRSV